MRGNSLQILTGSSYLLLELENFLREPLGTNRTVLSFVAIIVPPWRPGNWRPPDSELGRRLFVVKDSE
jgi:hypothetical protein